LLLEDCAGIISTELWWTNQEFSPVDIIPQWFFMLTYQLVDERTIGLLVVVVQRDVVTIIMINVTLYELFKGKQENKHGLYSKEQ
jgi:quinol-cytochrome oxidoreductase complex cytochrome b subunit